VTWDDWGGWYDHVPPPQVIADGTSWGSGYVYGFRVPLIVISPYAKAAHISHVNHDFGSILHFMEENFGLSSLDTPMPAPTTFPTASTSTRRRWSFTPSTPH
jgi:phospholipase C